MHRPGPCARPVMPLGVAGERDLEIVRTTSLRWAAPWRWPPSSGRHESPASRKTPLPTVIDSYTLEHRPEMSKRFTGIRIDEDLLAGLDALKKRDGAAIAESVRRAIRAYLVDRGVAVEKPDKKRPAKRRQANG